MKSLSFKQTAFWTILIYAIYQLSGYPLSHNIPKPLYLSTMIGITIISTSLILYLNISSEEKNPIEKKKKKVDKDDVYILGISGIVISFILQKFTSIIEILFTNTSPTSQNTQNITSIVKAAPIFIFVVAIAAPIMEELVFRRAIAGFLSLYLNEWIAIIISSALFSIAHMDGHYLTYFMMGFLFALLYRSTGSIYTSMITHAGMNAFVMFLQILLT